MGVGWFYTIVTWGFVKKLSFSLNGRNWGVKVSEKKSKEGKLLDVQMSKCADMQISESEN